MPLIMYCPGVKLKIEIILPFSTSVTYLTNHSINMKLGREIKLRDLTNKVNYMSTAFLGKQQKNNTPRHNQLPF